MSDVFAHCISLHTHGFAGALRQRLVGRSLRAQEDRDADHAFGRSRSIEAGSPGDQRLTEWLDERPGEDFFERTLRIIRALPQVLPPDERAARRRDLLSHCAQVATASGGLLGFGTVTEAEQALLDRIAAELEWDLP